jgi:uncharacterized protein YjbI with pentapeptide repeats
LRDADLRESVLNGTRFVRCDLRDAVLEDADRSTTSSGPSSS